MNILKRIGMRNSILSFILLLSFSLSAQVRHKVKKNETLFGISKQYDVSITSIKEANPFVLQKGLQVGQTLYIPETAVRLDSIGGKLIANKLIDCEATEKSLNLVTQVLKKEEDKGSLKDKVINLTEKENSTLESQISAQNQIIEQKNKEFEEQKKKTEKESVRKVVNKYVYFCLGAVLGGGGTYLLLH